MRKSSPEDSDAGFTPQADLTDEERLWATFSHLSGLLGWVFPLGNLIAPAALLWWHKDQSRFVSDQAKEALNFQLTLTLAVMASVMLMYVLIGFLLMGLVIFYGFVMLVIAAVKANKGTYYRYPLTFRFIP